MRAVLIIFAVLGVLAIAFGVAIVGGWVRLPNGGRYAVTTRPATGPAGAMADWDEPDSEDPAATQPAAADAPAFVAAVPEDRTINLSAADATTTGRTVRSARTTAAIFGRKAGKAAQSTSVKLADADAKLEWDVDVPQAGTYSVNVTCAYGKKADGLTDPLPLHVSANGKTATGAVEPHGKYMAYRVIEVGELELPQGRTKLSVQLDRKVGSGSGIYVKGVRLIPVAK